MVGFRQAFPGCRCSSLDPVEEAATCAACSGVPSACARDPKANAAHVGQLFRLWGEGRIAPKVTETFSLADGGKAIAKMAARR